MSASKTRYITPAMFFIIIGGTAAFIIYLVTSQAPPTTIMNIPDIRISTVILMVLAASIPILFLEYYLLAVPIAFIFLFGNRILKAASYEMNIMNIGRKFSGRHMIRRTAAPALFAVAWSDIPFVRDFIETWVFIIPPEGYSFLHEASLSLMSALIFMPVALLIFMPTWVLNDSGIVTHLKEGKLDIRQCPDTQGVGRWLSGIFGGYALIAFPMTMFTTHLYNPYFAVGAWPSEIELLNSLLLIAGLPLFVMAFILPVVGFNERSQTRVRKNIAGFASKLGATIVRKERIEKAQRIVREGILTEVAGKEIVSTAKSMSTQKQNDRKVVSSRKSTPKKKDNSKKKKKK